jgi:hypothetical protein
MLVPLELNFGYFELLSDSSAINIWHQMTSLQQQVELTFDHIYVEDYGKSRVLSTVPTYT